MQKKYMCTYEILKYVYKYTNVSINISKKTSYFFPMLHTVIGNDSILRHNVISSKIMRTERLCRVVLSCFLICNELT